MSLLALPALGAAAKTSANPCPYPVVRSLGALQDPAITESSGIAAGRRNPGLFWTHNDSGDGPFVYALGPHGEKRGTFRLRGVPSVTDCEDIAIGPGPQAGVPYLYLGDIGDNNRVRSECVVWRVPEPTVTRADAASSQSRPSLTQTATPLRCRYPDGPHDAESLLIHPRTGRLYIVAKNRDGVDGVYAFPATSSPRAAATLSRAATIRISGEPPFYPDLVTGGDIAPDGCRLVLRTYWNAYEFRLPPGKPFDAIWRTHPTVITLPLQPQGEGIGYTYPKGDAVLLTSEGKGTTLYMLKRR